MSKCIVIGGGAAGMLAAYSAALQGHRVILLEKNEKLGKKDKKNVLGGLFMHKLKPKKQFTSNSGDGERGS